MKICHTRWGGWHQKQVKKERNTHRTDEMEDVAELGAGESKRKRERDRRERQRDKINREGEEERDQKTNKQKRRMRDRMDERGDWRLR